MVSRGMAQAPRLFREARMIIVKILIIYLVICFIMAIPQEGGPHDAV